jgi:hypothetical protein
MKKLITTSVCAVAITGAAFAQGTVNWNVLSPAAITAQTNATVASSFGASGPLVGSTVGATGAAANGFYYALLYSAYSGNQAAVPTTAAQLASWTATGLTAVNSSTSAGKLSPVNPSTQASVPWANGTTESVVLAGWSANLGTSWSTVENELANWANVGSSIPGIAFFGLSSTGYINPGTANPGVQVFAAAAGPQGLPIYSLNTQLDEVVSVPEPGTLALAALGGASLLMFRRKK